MKKNLACFIAAAFAVLVNSLPATAQQEFPPPSGQGRVVVVLAGAGGAPAYRQVSGLLAGLGYDVVLFETNGWGNTKGQAMREAIATAQKMPHALPGKVGVVGFSLGGGYALGYGTIWSDRVAVVAAWYPLTSTFTDAAAWAGRIKVPTVMFAGENDIYDRCCLIDRARELGKAAQAAGAPFELFTYPNTPHAFVLGADGYKPQAHGDAFARTKAALAKALN